METGYGGRLKLVKIHRTDMSVENLPKAAQSTRFVEASSESVIPSCMMECMDNDTQSKRVYQMRKRREDIEETRQRIVDAAVELHGSVGPAHTTFSAVAERAGVQRSTLYRHFPDEASLFGACTSHWLAQHPWPSVAQWESIADPRERLLRGLRDLYRYFAANEQMLANSYRDIEVMPSFVSEFMRATIATIHATLLAPWPEAARSSSKIGAGLHHAIDFRAWSSLRDAGLGTDEAAELMTVMVSALAPAATGAVRGPKA